MFNLKIVSLVIHLLMQFELRIKKLTIENHLAMSFLRIFKTNNNCFDSNIVDIQR